jgi:hypothetical protein
VTSRALVAKNLLARAFGGGRTGGQYQEERDNERRGYAVQQIWQSVLLQSHGNSRRPKEWP